MKTGDIVEVSGYVTKGRTYGSKETTIVELDYKQPIKAIVLGRSQRLTGTLTSDYDGPYGEQGSYLTRVESHPVWMVMPLDDHNRYRSPVAVKEEQVIVP